MLRKRPAQSLRRKAMWVGLFGSQPPSNVSFVIAFAVSHAKIGIVPQLAIGLIEGQFALIDSIGEFFHRHVVVNVRDLAVVDKRTFRTFTDGTNVVLHS